METFWHEPVLLKECIFYLRIKPDGTYIDGTIGGAGHSEKIYESLSPKGTLVGIDRDIEAIEASRQRLANTKKQGKFILEKDNFKNIKEICQRNSISKVDGIILDLGVSSHQLDQQDRGFSYQKDAPLDMRMDRTGDLSAKIIVNEFSQEEIKEIIWDYGEERWASRIASFIVEYRNTKTIETTQELVDIIKAAIPAKARREGPHPAKRTFQALRIAVNGELEILDNAIEEAVDLLSPEGRILIITFHSLEDRIVKRKFKEKSTSCICPKELPQCVCKQKRILKIVTKKPITASQEELSINPRSRSAKLRVAEKI